MLQPATHELLNSVEETFVVKSDLLQTLSALQHLPAEHSKTLAPSDCSLNSEVVAAQSTRRLKDRFRLDPLRGSLADFARPSGPNLISRTEVIIPWVENRAKASVWPFARAISSAPQTSEAARILIQAVEEARTTLAERF